MAVDATGTPTSLGIPKFLTGADAPSGKGSNSQMDSIDTLIAARITNPVSKSSTQGLVWNGSAWVAQNIADANVAGGAAIAYSKLALTGAVQNTDLAGSIDPTKLTAGSAEQVIVTRGGTPQWARNQHSPYSFSVPTAATDWLVPSISGGGLNLLLNCTLNLLVLIPIWIPVTTTYSVISIAVGTAGTASNVSRVGIYSASTNRLPDTLVREFGTVSTTTTGVKTVTDGSPATYTENTMYWLAHVSQVGTAQQPIGYQLQRSEGVPQISNPLSNVNFSPAMAFGKSATSGALPASLSGLTIVDTSSEPIPCMALRRA